MKSSYDTETLERIRHGRKHFIAMAGAYSLGVLNDSLFRQAVIFLAVAADMLKLRSAAIVIFSLPYIVFAAPAGWLADRFAKRNVVIGAKALELAAMICGAVGICTGNWALILTMLAVMGLQSAVFNPALNGSIPELYPAVYVTRANAILRVVVNSSILLGIALSGVALDLTPRNPTGWVDGDPFKAAGGIPPGNLAVAFAVVAVSALGVVISLGVPKRPPAAPGKKFPWSGPADTLKALYETRKDPLLAVAVAASTFFWFIGALQVLVLTPLGEKQFGLSKSITSALIVAELAGVAVGGLVSSKLAVGKRWFRVLAPAVFVMGACMFAVAAIPFAPRQTHAPLLFLALSVMGIAGGVLSIPVDSFIQVHPAPDRKGATIAAANFASFCGIILAGPASAGLDLLAGAKFTNGFAVMGGFAFFAGIALLLALSGRDKTCSDVS